MKKQTLFDLTSMPKMVLVITLIVMLGLLFGATSYLLKAPKTDLPIINPIVETQCEIDSDCELVYVGQDCLPCDTSDEEYKCLSLNEVSKIWEKRQRMFYDNNIDCLLCTEKPQHICKCANGKCEKVKKELVEEVSITTDKMEYEQGEMVEIIIKNDSDRELFFRLSIESFDNSKWNRIVKDIRCDCNLQNCPIPQLPIKANSEGIKFWDQKKGLCDELLLGQKLRIKMMCGEGSNYIVYSNEFTIKEKSALDARCGEKVKGVGFCRGMNMGYEFNSEAEVCVIKEISGCSVESPFKTLEECQEVCEKNSDTSNWQTYRNEEFGFEFKYPKVSTNDKEIFLKEKNNLIQVCLKPHGDNDWCHSLKYYEKLNKETFENSIKRQILDENEQIICTIEDARFGLENRFKMYYINCPSDGPSKFAYNHYIIDSNYPELFFMYSTGHDRVFDINKWINSIDFF